MSPGARLREDDRRDRDKRHKDRLQKQAATMVARPDMLEKISKLNVECNQGDRVLGAHVHEFTRDTEELVERVCGQDARTEDIVSNFMEFWLGRLLDVIDNADRCETCLRIEARTQAQAIKLVECEQQHLNFPIKLYVLDSVDLSIYVNDTYIRLLRMIPHFSSTPAIYTPLYLNFKNKKRDRRLSIHSLELQEESVQMLQHPNAGGNSLDSEVLSFEILKRVLPWWGLSTMEMTTEYDSSGPLTDFVTRYLMQRDREMSVSVTRIFGWNRKLKAPKHKIEEQLVKKLEGLKAATPRILPIQNRGMILFAWVNDGRTEKDVKAIYQKLNRTHPDITSNVIVFVAVADQDAWMDPQWRARHDHAFKCKERHAAMKSSEEVARSRRPNIRTRSAD